MKCRSAKSGGDGEHQPIDPALAARAGRGGGNGVGDDHDGQRPSVFVQGLNLLDEVGLPKVEAIHAGQQKVEASPAHQATGTGGLAAGQNFDVGVAASKGLPEHGAEGCVGFKKENRPSGHTAFSVRRAFTQGFQENLERASQIFHGSGACVST